MKKLILALITLTSCSTIEITTNEYLCIFYTGHGTFARANIVAASKAEAEKLATEDFQKRFSWEMTVNCEKL